MGTEIAHPTKVAVQVACPETDHADAWRQQQQQQQRPSGDEAPPVDERLTRFIESLRQLSFAPPSPIPSCSGSDAGGPCGASTVSISPSDSASCCLHGAQRGGAAWDNAELRGEDAAPEDVQAAVERCLARQLRQLQLQHKAAIFGAAAKAPRRPSARPQQHPPHQHQQPGRLRSQSPSHAAGDRAALLQCSPGSTLSSAGARHHAPARSSGASPDAPARGRCDTTTTKPPAPATAAPAPRGRRGVFVGNLPSSATERALMGLFSRCGRIDRLWIARDPRNQASLGYGYVVFAPGDPLAHVRAARSLDGTPLERQPVRVRPSDRDFDALPPQQQAQQQAQQQPQAQQALQRQRPRPRPRPAAAAAAAAPAPAPAPAPAAAPAAAAGH